MHANAHTHTHTLTHTHTYTHTHSLIMKAFCAWSCLDGSDNYKKFEINQIRTCKGITNFSLTFPALLRHWQVKAMPLKLVWKHQLNRSYHHEKFWRSCLQHIPHPHSQKSTVEILPQMATIRQLNEHSSLQSRKIFYADQCCLLN